MNERFIQLLSYRRFVASCALLTAVMSPLAVHALESPAELPSQETIEHTQISISAERESLNHAGETRVFIRFDIDEGWHTYWRNPGAVGLPTVVNAALPAGLSLGELESPVPEMFSTEGIVSYGFEDVALFGLPIRVGDSSVLQGRHVAELEISWAVCKDRCIPAHQRHKIVIEDGRFVDLPVLAQSPRPETVPVLSGVRAPTQAGQRLMFSFDPPEQFEVTAAANRIAIGTPDLVDEDAAQQWRLVNGRVEVELGLLSDAPIRNVLSLNGMLFYPDATGSIRRFSFAFSHQSDQKPWAFDLSTLLLVLGSAFIGGLILNLMPCVFPVLSLKIASLAEHANGSHARAHLLLFAAGVIVSFVALALLLVALRVGGAEVGWGFQFQSPTFIALMVLLTFGLGLNLIGVFEIGLAFQSKVGAVKVSEGLLGSFWSGVLATALATPCTAPFMGSAIAYALAAPVWCIVLVFTALGVGLAAPFLAIAALPAIIRFIPRPGPWMENLKQFLSFPMFATTAWLLGVFGAQQGTFGMTRCAFSLVLVAFAGWQLGKWGSLERSVASRHSARAMCALMTMLSIYVALPSEREAEASTIRAEQLSESGWEHYSADRAAALKAEGRAVLIDFTAEWCLVCKVNHMNVFGSAAIRSLLRQKNVALLRADWTKKDAEITRALASFGRSGVPFVILQHATSHVEFDGLISKSSFQAALEDLADSLAPGLASD